MLKRVTTGLAAAVVLSLLAGAASAADEVRVAALVMPRPDRVVVLKSERKLVLMRGAQVVRVYDVALGRYPRGRKERQGDARTPEGRYVLDYRLEDSAFHKAIHISYPNAFDRARAQERGVDPGGRIMIHGLPDNWSAKQLGHPWLDWTQGCIAVTNEEIDELFQLVDVGTPIEIHP